MRELITLIEGLFYKGDFRAKYATTAEDIEVLSNPSAGELRRFKARTSGDLRGLLQDDLLVWDAFIATHSDVAAFFKVDGSDLHLEDNGVSVNDCPDDWTDEEAEKAADWIKAHPSIVRLYGADVAVSMEAPDSGQTWFF